MSDYISKNALLETLVRYKFGAISNDAEREYTKEMVLLIASEQPTLDEKEIIRKAFERVVERLEERHENHKNNILKYQERKDWDMCSRTSNIKVENEIAIEIVKEVGGIE